MSNPSTNPLANEGDSIHSRHLDQVVELPIKLIRRPILPILDHEKVICMKESLEKGDSLPPIDVYWIQHEGKDYYYSFGGCHRWEAHKQLDKDIIRCKLFKAEPEMLSTYLGASNPFTRH